MKEAEGAKLFSADVQSAYHIVVIKSGLKPRMVSLKGREDDTTSSSSICTSNSQNQFDVVERQEKAEKLQAVRLANENKQSHVKHVDEKEKSSNPNTIHQGVQQFVCFSWLPRTEQGQVPQVEEIYFVETNDGILVCYSHTRPPGLDVHVRRFRWWRLLSLRDIG